LWPGRHVSVAHETWTFSPSSMGVIQYHSFGHMRRESSRPDTSAVQRLAESSADLTAATVNGLQEVSRRRRTFSARRVMVNAIGNGTRSTVNRLLPRTSPPTTTSPAMLALLRFMLSTGAPASSTFVRTIMGGTVRAAPVVWRVSQDKRARSVGAMLLRIVFGPKSRPSR
jgi:hypothetical protein